MILKFFALGRRRARSGYCVAPKRSTGVPKTWAHQRVDIILPTDEAAAVLHGTGPQIGTELSARDGSLLKGFAMLGDVEAFDFMLVGDPQA